MTRFRLSLFVLLILSLGQPALAQEQSGSIQGVVKDAQGGILPGVTVEARSARNTGVVTSVTDTNGVFRFPALAPGSYEFTGALTGFTSAKAAATVVLGQNLKVDLTLKLGGLTESVQVTGEAPLIDTKANAATSTVTRETIDLIPKGRGLLSVLTQIPGTNNESRGGGLMIDGASGSENRFLVDGVDRTNPRTGTANAITGTEVVTQDFIETVQVKQSGYNAEFRAALGGVVSAQTRSGTNSFKGSAGVYYNNNKWLGDRRPTLRQVPTNLALAEQIITPRDKFYQVDPVATLGGPILKDKAWFFIGYGPQFWRQERTVTWVTPGVNPPTQTFDTGRPNQKALNYNITTQFTSKLRARVTGSNERRRGELASGLPGIEPNGTSTSNATTFNPRSTIRTDQKNDNYSGIFDFTASNSLYLNLTAAYYDSDLYSTGGDYNHNIRRTFTTANTNLVGVTVPVEFQRVSGFADGAASTFNVQDRYTRFNLSTDATMYKRWKGDHAIKIGGLYERIGNQANLGAQHPTIALNWGGTYANLSGGSNRGTYGFFTVSRTYTGGDIKETNLSLFAQDQWTINNKLTVNYGLRIENEEIPSYKPENPGVEFGWGDKIAPRLGFAYDVKGDGKWKGYGSWGVFYDTMKLEMPRGAWGGDHWIDYVYTLNTFDWPSINCTDINGGTTCTGGTFIEQNDRRHPSNELGKSLVDPNLKPTKKQEITLGFDRELGSVMSLGVRYARKWWNETIDDVGVSVPGVGEVYYIANPGSGFGASPLGAQFPTVPKVLNQYDGIEVSLRKRFSNRWQGTSSILFSRLYGNYGGLASSDEAGRNAPNVSRYYDALYLSFDQKGNEANGKLNTDRPIQFKVQGTYSFDFGTHVGLNFYARSGTLNSSTVTYQSVPVYYKGRGDLGRTPFLNQTDLTLTHDFKVKGDMKLTLMADVQNVFDQKTVTQIAFAAYRDALVIPGFANNPGGAFFQPGGFDTDAIQAARLPTSGRPDPRYKLPNAYQGARSIRVMARVSF